MLELQLKSLSTSAFNDRIPLDSGISRGIIAHFLSRAQRRSRVCEIPFVSHDHTTF